MTALHDPKRRWHLMLTVAIGGFIAALVASMVYAGKKASPVVDTQYYEHGLHYGQALRNAERGTAGWRMIPSFAEGELTVEVRDRAGNEVSGGRVSYQPRQVGEQQCVEVRLTEKAPGIYGARCGIPKGSDQHGTLRFSKGEAVVASQVVLLN